MMNDRENCLMPIGTKVRMVNCSEAKDYPNTIWETRSEPWMVCGTEVVLLKGRAGGFSVNCLEVVENMGNEALSDDD